MFTGTPDQLREREQRARELAEQVAALLNQISGLGFGPAMGNLITPGAQIVNRGGQWSVR